MHDVYAQMAAITDLHRLVGDEYAKRCTVCGISISRRTTPRHEPGTRTWLRWYAPDGRIWDSFPEGDSWVTYPDNAPSCPPQKVEAACPWEENARRYGGVWGDVQLETAMRTWCDRHQMAVADCPAPGPACPGAAAHEYEAEEGRPGPCTGQQDGCLCMCPACCGDTPDVWGAPV
ncbi:hypothetical protein ACFVYE_32375 [Streptomyces sp. NPDC058239]|uniref:hypothetical protein n=1 Tax=Streptomyces sp. NPDC058239 TaxID=3346395 RepID=UPI0036E6371D